MNMMAKSVATSPIPLSAAEERGFDPGDDSSSGC
jgi:hypothetical protein